MEVNTEHQMTVTFAIMNFLGMEHSQLSAENWQNSLMIHFDDQLSKKNIFRQSFWSVAETLGN